MSATPVCNSEEPTTKIESIVMTAEEANPINASFAVTKPVNIRIKSPKHAVKSTGIFFC